METINNYLAVTNQSGPAQDVSNRYAFVPTTRVLDVLADYGWMPSQVKESKVRKEEHLGYQSHIVRLRNSTLSPIVREHEYYPEIVVRNSHNRGSGIELSLGIWRLVCSNGLMAGQAYGVHKIRHVGFATAKVEEAIHMLAGSATRVLDSVESFRSIRLPMPEQREFAAKAIDMKWNSDEGKFVMNPDAVLMSRRWADRSDDLWTVFNRVQENLIKGGTRGWTADGKRRSDRAVTQIARNVELNRGLWELADEFATRYA